MVHCAGFIEEEEVINPKPKPAKKEKPKKKRSVRKRPIIMLQEQADRLVRRIVLIRDDELCVCPEPKHGHSQNMQAGHLVTRAKKSVRWDLWNVSVQCSGCNMLHEYQPERYTRWFIEKFGSKTWLDLIERSSHIQKYSTEYMEDLIVGLEGLYKGIQAFPGAKQEYYLTQEEIVKLGKERRE